MGFLKDAGDSVVKFGTKLVSKTEDYTRIARLNIEIKRLAGDIEKVKAKIGAHALDAGTEGKSRIDLHSSFINDCVEKISDFDKQIAGKKKEIEDIKKKDESAGAQDKQ